MFYMREARYGVQKFRPRWASRVVTVNKDLPNSRLSGIAPLPSTAAPWTFPHPPYQHAHQNLCKGIATGSGYLPPFTDFLPIRACSECELCGRRVSARLHWGPHARRRGGKINPVLDQILGGWAVSTITTFSQGNSFEVNSPKVTSAIFSDFRADRLCDGRKSLSNSRRFAGSSSTTIIL